MGPGSAIEALDKPTELDFGIVLNEDVSNAVRLGLLQNLVQGGHAVERGVAVPAHNGDGVCSVIYGQGISIVDRKSVV